MNREFILTTTNNVQGYFIEQYIGVVTSVVIRGVHFGKDIQQKISDKVGGRAGFHEEELDIAIQEALDLLIAKAVNLAANKGTTAHALIGLSFDFEPSGARNGMVAILISGTVVKLKKVEF
jgi:uncharacterized protein YbjQ (UPF0145 family)